MNSFTVRDILTLSPYDDGTNPAPRFPPEGFRVGGFMPVSVAMDQDALNAWKVFEVCSDGRVNSSTLHSWAMQWLAAVETFIGPPADPCIRVALAAVQSHADGKTSQEVMRKAILDALGLSPDDDVDARPNWSSEDYCRHPLWCILRMVGLNHIGAAVEMATRHIPSNERRKLEDSLRRSVIVADVQYAPIASWPLWDPIKQFVESLPPDISIDEPIPLERMLETGVSLWQWGALSETPDWWPVAKAAARSAQLDELRGVSPKAADATIMLMDELDSRSNNDRRYIISAVIDIASPGQIWDDRFDEKAMDAIKKHLQG